MKEEYGNSKSRGTYSYMIWLPTNFVLRDSSMRPTGLYRDTYHISNVRTLSNQAIEIINTNSEKIKSNDASTRL